MRNSLNPRLVYEEGIRMTDSDRGKGITTGIAGLIIRICCVLKVEDNIRMAFKK